MSLLAVPAVAVVRAVDGRSKPVWMHTLAALGDPRLERRPRAARADVPGRAGRGRASSPAPGRSTAATFAVGTMAGSLGPTVFGHLPDALALFAALDPRHARPAAATGSGSGCSPASACCSSTRPASPRSSCVIYAALRGGRRARSASSWPAACRRRSSSAPTTGSPSARRGGSRTATRRTSSPRSSSRTCSASGCRPRHGIWTLLVDGHGLLLVSPVLLAAIAGPRPLPAPPAALEADVGDRDRARLRDLHGRLLPAERRPLAGPALRHRGAAVPAARAAVRARSAGASSRSSSPRSRSASRSSTSSRGRSRTGSSSSPGRRRSGRCSGSRARPGRCCCSLRRRRGARRRYGVRAASEAVLRSATP